MDLLPSLSSFLESLEPAHRSQVQFHQIIRFMTVMSRIKDDVLLVQPSDQSTTEAPQHISASIVLFLSTVCSLPEPVIRPLWVCVRDVVWNELEFLAPDRELSSFLNVGTQYGFSYRTLYPPHKFCPNLGCRRTGKGLALSKAESRQVVIFTLDVGTLPAWSTHFYCEECQINYHHNFSVAQGRRHYYAGIPDVLQVGEHQFAEVKLINAWITLMVVAWASATNIARFYNLALGPYHGQNLPELVGWQFKGAVEPDHVYDAFTILSLLEDCERNNVHLDVPHTGSEFDRFQEAVTARNNVRRFYHPNIWHACDSCSRMWNDKLNRVVVIDGVTLGRPCCRIPNCKEPLASNKNRFCPTHSPLSNICCITGCNKQCIPRKRTCDDAAHQAVEDAYIEVGTARFQLQKQLERAFVANPEMSEAKTQDLTGPEGEAEFVLNAEGGAVMGPQASGSGSSTGGKKLKAQFGRNRTHNEQVFTAPCGMIIARETFYHAEGVGAVAEMIQRVYRQDGTLPEHIFYDNNCSLAKVVKNIPWFNDKNVKLTVDVFHFKSKHAVTDEFCQKNCNPVSHPELAGEGGKAWYFNSSIAEQTNVWLGGYHSICREMTASRYEFFLDEMIDRRNAMTLERLQKSGAKPRSTYMEM